MPFLVGNRMRLGAAVAASTFLFGLLTFPNLTHGFGFERTDDIHKRITDAAYGFLRPNITEAIGDANRNQDKYDPAKDDCVHHACNCQFRASASYYNGVYEQMIAGLKEPQPRSPVSPSAYLWGSILHGIQDFYSHSNWVAKYPAGLDIKDRLLDSGLGNWTILTPYTVLLGDVMVLEGDPPGDVKVRLPLDANGKVSAAVPLIEDRRMYNAVNPGPLEIAPAEALKPNRKKPKHLRGKTEQGAANDAARVNNQPPTAMVRHYRGLMTSGSVIDKPGQTYYPQQKCPPAGSDCKESSKDNVCLRHGKGRHWPTHALTYRGEGNLNMDEGGEGEWAAARHLAKRQSIHEWCRLLNLSRDLDPSLQATGRLLGVWVRSGHSAHPAGTPCRKLSDRTHKIKVTARPGSDGPNNIPWVLSRADFTDSKRGSVDGGSYTTLEICANAGENLLATLVPEFSRGAASTITVPEETRNWDFTDHRGAFPVRYTVKVTANGCR